MRRVLAFLLVSVAVFTASLASAAATEGIDAQMFRPSIFNGNFVAMEDAHTLDRMCYGAGLWFNYANSVVELRADNKFAAGIINSVYTGNLVAAVAPFSWLSLGVDVPYHVGRVKEFNNLTQSINSSSTGAKKPQSSTLTNKYTPGDIKAEMKLGILREASAGIGLAVAGFATFPTGDPTLFLGEGTTNFGGKLMLEKVLFSSVNVGINAGYLVRPTRTIFGTDISNAYLYGVGLSRTIVGGLSASLEWWGEYFVTVAGNNVQGNPSELTATLRYKFGNGLRFVGGGGGGTSSGVGAPSYRFLGGIDYYPHCTGPTQGKLIVNVVDEKNNPLLAAVTISGPKVADPNAKPAKTFKIVTDEQGEYMTMTDPGEFSMVALRKEYLPGTGKGEVYIGKKTQVTIVLKPKPIPTTFVVNVVYKKDQTPINAPIIIKNKDTGKVQAKPAVMGKFEDKAFEAGNYTISAGGIGAYERIDQDGKKLFVKKDGGLIAFERIDQDVQVVEAKDNAVTIELRKKIIQIGKIQFDYDKADLRPESFPILEDVLKKIHVQEDEGAFKKIIIEGHASSEGSDEYNLKLTQRRAESVRNWLAKKGIKAEILEPIGYGESRPIADNDTPEGMEQNRRVEFIFEE